MIIPLIWGAFAVIAIAGLVLLWIFLDRKVTHRGQPVIEELRTRLEAAENEVMDLRRRVEDLETIAASEP